MITGPRGVSVSGPAKRRIIKTLCPLPDSGLKALVEEGVRPSPPVIVVSRGRCQSCQSVGLFRRAAPPLGDQQHRRKQCDDGAKDVEHARARPAGARQCRAGGVAHSEGGRGGIGSGCGHISAFRICVCLRRCPRRNKGDQVAIEFTILVNSCHPINLRTAHKALAKRLLQ